MSSFTDQQDDAGVICPYCHYTYQPEPCDYDENSQDAECGECGKRYWVYQSFSVTHHTTPDCELNGGEHKFGHHVFHTVPTSRLKYNCCSVCDKLEISTDKGGP